jgi:hypothetical protein
MGDAQKMGIMIFKNTKNKKLNELDQENIEKWLLSLIRKIERDKISRKQILSELKELRKYFFN